MEPNDISSSSDEDEQTTKDVSSMKLESDNESIQLPIAISNDLTQSNNQGLQIHGETGQNLEFNPYDEYKSLQVQEGRSPVRTTDEDSASNVSFTVGGENLRTSQSMVPSTSTALTCGSSSSNVTSSEDESVDDLEDIERESVRVWYLDNPLYGLPRGAVKHILKSPSSTSSSGTNLGNKSQTAFTSAKEPSFQNDSNASKSSDASNSSNSLPTSSSAPSISGSSRKSLSSLSKIPMSLKQASPEEYDWDLYKSCEVKTEPSISSKTSSLLTSLSAPSIYGSSRKGLVSLLPISKSLQQTSPEEDNWDIYKSSCIGDEKKYFVPKPWVEDLISFGYKVAIQDAILLLDTESLLLEVQDFFQNNRVDADVNLSWEESKHRIITSKYFSDEFSRSHGLATHEEIMKEDLKDLDSYISPILKCQRELIELCITLMESEISEETVIEYVGRQLLELLCNEYDVDSIEPSDLERQGYLRTLFHPIDQKFDFIVMVKLYKKLMYEGATFLSILS